MTRPSRGQVGGVAGAAAIIAALTGLFNAVSDRYVCYPVAEFDTIKYTPVEVGGE